MKFIRSVFEEMKKVTWPTFNENIHNTTVVIITSLFFALFLGSADWIFEQGITFLSK
ncbi:preprotein translocase subunit SecE [Weissella uvarum]|uniref:preprotein translocase subunit SecE n=1 Tax=Weissella uvarum TaxID=1479233 RepID=UPI0019613BFD|nr:preprotein translocase subunit SecE [Weissella uvarum]MBM7616744.1 preprotein translocase subunit SecE [Weissella uvarum]MCM0594803.1 preprotein translocase subunit SecE [Weissella uvarum]